MSDSETLFRFEQLLGLYLEDDLEGEALEELIDLVKENQELGLELQRQLGEDQFLYLFEERQRKDHHFEEGVLSALDQHDEDFTQSVLSFTDENIQKIERNRRINVWAWAACLCIAALYAFELLSSKEKVDEGVAILTHLKGKVVQDYDVGDRVSPGIIDLIEGEMVLTFYRGAEVSVVSPAKLKVIDSMNVHCLSGKMRTSVPVVARGFTVTTPDSKVVDLGTEFGLEVSPQGLTKVHVFDGEVETYKLNDSKSQLVKAGEGVIPSSGQAWAIDELSYRDLRLMGREKIKKESDRAARWNDLHRHYLKDERLIAYYDFEPDGFASNRLVNRSASGRESDGAIIGASWGRGPWPGKQAINFRSPEDRVRVYIPGKHKEVTLACWVRVDVYKKSLSSLMLSDGTGAGDLHWQINGDRMIQLGVYYSHKRGTYHTNRPLREAILGEWIHLACVIDLNQGVVRQYKNGVLTVEKKAASDVPVEIGFATLGNWDSQEGKRKNYIRNLVGGMAEFMAFGVALDEGEIQDLALRQPMPLN